jgi:hypothetical protein
LFARERCSRAQLVNVNISNQVNRNGTISWNFFSFGSYSSK